MQKELIKILDNFLEGNNVQPILCNEDNIVAIINHLNKTNLSSLQELRENIYQNVFLFETEDKTFKIEKTREIIEKSSIKPGEKFNIFIIREIDKFSIGASNSLLKLFEDVPERLIILLTTSSKNNLLETISSRILDFGSDEIVYELSTISKSIIDDFFRGDKSRIVDLVFGEKIERFEYIAILEYLLVKLRYNNSNPEIITKILDGIRSIHTTNTNPKYILDTVILSL